MKRSLRIYCRTRDGFCNSGRKRPPCRMTPWMADNELKDLRFCLIHRLPKKFRFSYKRTLLKNGHSARSETESQNLLENDRIVILRGAKRSRRISPLSKHQHNSLKSCSRAQFPTRFLNFLGSIQKSKNRFFFN